MGSTYVACELMHGAILGHVVFLVRIILWKEQPCFLNLLLVPPPGRQGSGPSGTWASETGQEKWGRSITPWGLRSPWERKGGKWVLKGDKQPLLVACPLQELLRQVPGGPAHSS